MFQSFLYNILAQPCNPTVILKVNIWFVNTLKVGQPLYNAVTLLDPGPIVDLNSKFG
jgi:hypothetical protein